MSRSVKLPSNKPSVEDFRKSLGIGKTRAKAIIAIVEKSPAFQRAAARKAAEAARESAMCKKAKHAVAG